MRNEEAINKNLKLSPGHLQAGTFKAIPTITTAPCVPVLCPVHTEPGLTAGSPVEQDEMLLKRSIKSYLSAELKSK